MTGQTPYDDAKTTFELIRRITSGDLPKVDKHPAFAKLASLRKLVKSCWAQEPTERPTMAEIVPDLTEIVQAQT